jgi:photosystem II stability/assembly factor-like uncharacterized protein
MNHKAIARFWLMVVLLSFSLLPTLPPQAQERGVTESFKSVVLPAAPAGIPAYQAEPWVNLGGPPGGLGYDIRMQPDNPDIMYVTSAPGGVFKSTDGGRTWFSINTGISPWSGGLVWAFCVTIDPHDPNTVWVGTQFDAHIYRSPDGGESWEQRDNGIIYSAGEHSVRGITVDPNNPNVVYAALEDGAGGGGTHGEVYKSTNAGLNWARIWYGDNLARYVWIDPNDTDRLFVSTGIFDRDAANANPDGSDGGVGILRSENGGGTWTVLNEANGLGGLFVPSLFMHPTNPNVLLAAVTAGSGDFQAGNPTAPGVYLTQEDGDAWQQLFATSGEAVEIAVSDPNVWYAASTGVIFRSDDAGQTWQDFPMVTTDRESGIPIDLQVDPRDARRIFVNSYGGGNMLSTDGGETWADASRGYTGAAITAVAVAPGTGRTAFAGANTGTFRSNDGGQTWLGTELPSKVTGTDGGTAAMIFYSSGDGSGTKILASGGERDGDVYHSTDGGTTWISRTVVSNLEGSFVARALAVAPSDPQTVYIGYADLDCVVTDWPWCKDSPPGFFRSYDGGYIWEHVASVPYTDTSTLGLAVSPSDSRILYAATMNGPYRSQDGGDTWQLMESLDNMASGPLPDMDQPSVFVVATDPLSSSVVYAGSLGSGVYRSRDGGDTWEQTSAGMDPNEPINDLLPDPNRPGVLYAASGSGVFVSTDGADSWQQISDGLPIGAIRLALSDDGTVLYAGIGGAGVFRLGTPPTRIFLPLVLRGS